MIIDGDNGVNLDPLRFHVNQNKSDALLLLARVVCAHQTENPVRVLGICGPDLGAVDDEIVAVSLS